MPIKTLYPTFLYSLFSIFILTGCITDKNKEAETLYTKTSLLLEQFANVKQSSQERLALGIQIQTNLNTLNTTYLETEKTFDVVESGRIGTHDILEYKNTYSDLKFDQELINNPFLLFEQHIDEIKHSELKLYTSGLINLLRLYAENEDVKSFDRIALLLNAVPDVDSFVLIQRFSHLTDAASVKQLGELTDYRSYEAKLALAIAEGHLRNKLPIPVTLNQLFLDDFYNKFNHKRYLELKAEYDPKYKAKLRAIDVDLIIEAQDTHPKNKFYHYSDVFDCYLTYIGIDEQFTQAYLFIIKSIQNDLAIYGEDKWRVHTALININKLAFKHPDILELFDLIDLNLKANGKLRIYSIEKSNDLKNLFKDDLVSKIYLGAAIKGKPPKYKGLYAPSSVLIFSEKEKELIDAYAIYAIKKALYETGGYSSARRFQRAFKKNIEAKYLAKEGKPTAALAVLLEISKQINIKGAKSVGMNSSTVIYHWLDTTQIYLKKSGEVDSLYISHSKKLLNSFFASLKVKA